MVRLTGLSLKNLTFEGDNKLMLASAHKGNGLLVQLLSMEESLHDDYQEVEINKLLEEFYRIFDEPMGLPPKRTHDHRIILKDGIASISTRPYRYPH